MAAHFSILAMSTFATQGLEHRQNKLARYRMAKMARSCDDFVRGNTKQFYQWLNSCCSIPEGPAIWICGDCHTGNLGPVCGANGQIHIEIRDFDQTVIGNPAHDVVRLGLSLANAARGSDLAGMSVVKMLHHMLRGYATALEQSEKQPAELIKRPKSVEKAMRDASRREWADLATEQIENAKPTIPLGKRLWRLSKSEKSEMKQLFSQQNVRRMVTVPRSRDDDDLIEVIDAAYWVKGCSSVGRLRYVVLLKIGSKTRELCLIDIKEAMQPVCPACHKNKIPKDYAVRVVTGAEHLSPALGNRMTAAKFQGRPVFIRELFPQDLKLEIKHFPTKEAVKVASFMGAVVGKAHSRQMDISARKAWRKKLMHESRALAPVPSWLWESILTLMPKHEEAYLKHCHKYIASTEIDQ
jgi:uncharacterized protein (DUF2252 family)